MVGRLDMPCTFLQGHFPREAWPDLVPEFDKQYMKELCLFLKSKRSGNWHPPLNTVFRAYRSTHFGKVKAVIVGEDPYPNRSDATGLAFSAHPGQKPPRALGRVFDQLESDLEMERPLGGDLDCWAKQGVLLLNSALTVPAKTADSDRRERERIRRQHRSKWRGFTERTIALLSGREDPPDPIVFLFWGREAWRCAPFVRSPRHFVRLAGHPVPRRGGGTYANSAHFSQANWFRGQAGLDPILWDCVGRGS
jgi:uracil-DNA glycosylase